MSILTRLYDFVAGTKIRSAQVDAEFDQLVVGHNDHDAKIDAIQVGTGLADGSVVTIKLADGSVTTIKLADLSVVAAKIALGTITLAQMSLVSLDSRYYTEAESDAKYETITDLTTNRKLSALGDFTGTLNGYPIVAAEPALSSQFVGLKTDVLQRAVNVKSVPYNASGSNNSFAGGITSGSKALTLTTAHDFIVGQGINLRGVYEVASLTVTAGASSSSTVTVTLNGIPYLTVVTSGNTATQVAAAIRATDYNCWTTGGSGTTVTFTSMSTGNMTDATYSAGTTGVTGSMSTTTQGTEDQVSTVASVSGLIVNIADNSTRTISAGYVTHDDTLAIQSALDYLETVGGGKIFFPKGTYLISMAASVHGYSCLQVPSNIIFEGSGMGVTTFTRPASERAVNGVLIVNKYYDTATVYGAAGNIIFRNFTITDGTNAPYRGGGDLIGLGHANNVLIESVQSLNHDQHFVDICGSYNVTIRDCVCSNNSLISGSVTMQIDRATILGIIGLNLDGTSSKNVIIENNHFDKPVTSAVQIHNFCIAENILILNNFIDGSTLLASDNAIVFDPTTSAINVIISGNTIKLNANARGINISLNNDTVIRNLRISNNIIEGNFRVGMFVGATSLTATPDFADMTNITISDNTIDQSFGYTGGAAGGGYSISVSNTKSVTIENNTIRFTKATTTATDYSGVITTSNKKATVRNNEIVMTDTNTNPAFLIYGILQISDTLYSNSLLGRSVIKGNTIILSGSTICIYQRWVAGLTKANLIGVISQNTTNDSTVQQAHYYESVPSCDGTNDVMLVDFGAAGVVGWTNVLNLSVGTIYTLIPTPRIKGGPIADTNYPNRAMASFSYRKLYATFLNNLFTDTEEIQFSHWFDAGAVSRTAGTQLCDFNITQPSTVFVSNFSVITGKDGMSCVISNVGFDTVVRTVGYLMIEMGI